MTEVLLQHQNGNQLFPFLVTELFYKRMGIADDGFCFFNMCTVVLNLVFQIGVIGECQDFCVWGGYSRGSPTRLPFVFL